MNHRSPAFAKHVLSDVFKLKIMQNKLCPICRVEKPIEEYHRYFSKVRNMYRVGNYCKPCARVNSNKRAKEYYQDHKKKILQYQNVDRKKWKTERNKEHQENLTDRYVLVKLKQTLKGESNKNMRLFPEMIEAKRTKILTSRIKKQLKNGKK